FRITGVDQLETTTPASLGAERNSGSGSGSASARSDRGTTTMPVATIDASTAHVGTFPQSPSRRINPGIVHGVSDRISGSHPAGAVSRVTPSARTTKNTPHNT